MTINKRALVLGGRGDIGQAIVRRFENEGYEVVATGRGDFDLSDGASIDAWLSSHSSDYDVVVHSAGHNEPREFLALDLATIERGIDTNVMGFLRILKATVPSMVARGNGRVTVVSSLYAFLSRRGRLTYTMAKHALEGAVKTLAIELAGKGILVNAVAPGFVLTRMTRANNDDETIQRLTAGIPLGRMAAPEDIADVVYFVSSTNNKYITGQSIVVDGGYSVGGFQG